MPKLSFSNILKSSTFLLLAVGISTEGFSQQTGKPTTEPVYRVGKNNSETTLASSTESNVETTAETTVAPASASAPAETRPTTTSIIHNTALSPMERALTLAREGLSEVRSELRDYTAIMIKRERMNGVISDPEFMQVKIRNSRPEENIPFSVYIKFLKPTNIKGREVIWVEGHNNSKLIAHEPGMLTGNIRAKLDPNGFLAMRGNRHPITDAGIENLIKKLIEKGERDQRLGTPDVKFYENTKINGRKCTLIQVTHNEYQPHLEFKICRVFIDDELRVPIRYAGYGWPKTEGGKPTLDEEYTYLKIQKNVGLTDADFNPDNPKYAFP